ncbi:MAG: glutamate 5-kinase [Coriobacteriia bacterium]|jgi:glutamate 5-kinase|nr:glutamate 5-kinase [Coriobacteriia bacterium]
MCAMDRVVIKVGSSTLAPAGEGLDRAYVDSLMEQIAEVRREGTEVIVVTSGAIAAGVQALGIHTRPEDMPSLQASASVGQVQVLGMYAALAAAHGMTVGQVLLTRHDTAHRQAYLHARDTLERLLALGVVPVVNENDTVAVDEIRFGDNDTLAALVGTMARADLVVLLTDIEGLYDADPLKNADARLVEHVESLTDQVISAAGGATSGVGSGGMATKVEAARVLMRAGIPMVVCDGRRAGVIADALSGKPVGTLFAGGKSALGARKLWIALGGVPKGEIIVDDGAKAALCERGKSLLPAGVVSVQGVFAAGDAIVLKDGTGQIVARGLSALSSADLEKVKGMHSSRIADVLPSAAGKTVVHRDHLVIL